MTETLLLPERVKNTIQLGESHFREFKTALTGSPGHKKKRSPKDICKEIAEALVAFANADGGELLIGVEDDGTISGVPHAPLEIENMLQAYKTHVHPETALQDQMTFATKIEIDAKLLLFFVVAKGTTRIYQLPDGRCMRRKDKSTLPVSVEQLWFERSEIKSRESDRDFVDGATVNDLAVVFIQNLADQCLPGMSVEKYLQQLGMAEYAMTGLRLRKAALLLFAKDILRWQPSSQVRILKVLGPELKSGEHYNVAADETIRGNVFELLQKSWEQLRLFLADKTEFGPDAKFTQKYIYPEVACREALINAIAHRDYVVHNGIEVLIFDDRLEIRSPGALLSTLSIKSLEQLENVHESRNVFIARVLRENDYMRELGEGMQRMFKTMEDYELRKPRLYSNKSWFSITFLHQSIFSEDQQHWLEQFKQFALNPRQRKIVVAGIEGRELSPADIYKAMNTDDRNTYDQEVTTLRNANILQQIRTNSQAQSYAKQHNFHKSKVPRFRVRVP